MFVMVPMPPHAVAAMAAPRERDQEHDEQYGEERKEEMMRVRTNRIGRNGIKMRRSEQPDDRGNDQRKHRHAGQQMKPMMQAPMTSPLTLLVTVGRWRVGALVDGKFFADA